MPFISPALQTLLVEAFWETAGMVGLSAAVAVAFAAGLGSFFPPAGVVIGIVPIPCASNAAPPIEQHPRTAVIAIVFNRIRLPRPERSPAACPHVSACRHVGHSMLLRPPDPVKPRHTPIHRSC